MLEDEDNQTMKDYHGVPPVPLYHKSHSHRYSPAPWTAPDPMYPSMYSYAAGEIAQYPSMSRLGPGSASMTPPRFGGTGMSAYAPGSPFFATSFPAASASVAPPPEYVLK